MIPEPHEQAVILKIKELHSNGYTIRDIIAELSAEGIFHRNGKPFAIPCVHRIVKRAIHEKKEEIVDLELNALLWNFLGKSVLSFEVWLVSKK